MFHASQISRDAFRFSMVYQKVYQKVSEEADLYTRAKVDGTVTMYWFIPFGDCAMYFEHGVFRC